MIRRKELAAVAFLIGLLIGAWLVLCVVVANAAPPADRTGRYHSWFANQYSAAGAWCCDVADGHVLDDNDWRSTGTGYAVRIQGQWQAVPTDALRDPSKGGPNPTGHAIVWYRGVDLHIWCFAPGWEG